jgi:hypothetical protein
MLVPLGQEVLRLRPLAFAAVRVGDVRRDDRHVNVAALRSERPGDLLVGHPLGELLRAAALEELTYRAPEFEG